MTRTPARFLAALAPLLIALVLLAPPPARADVTADVTALLQQALAQKEPAAVRHDLTFATPPALAAAQGAAALASLDYQPRTGAFSAVIAMGNTPVRVTGRADAIAEIPALARAVSTGEHISASDIVFIETSANRLPADAVLDPAEIEGQEARRTLRPGVALRRFDVKIPSVILKNDLITVYYIRPGIQLAAQGRALADAPAGAAVRVLNLQSNRIIEARAEAPGRARVEAPRAYAALNQDHAQ